MTVLNVSSASGPPRPMTRPGVATPAQLTAIRSSPSSRGAVDRGLHLRLVAHVGGDEDGTALALGVELVDERRGGGALEVDDDDGRAVGDEAAGGGAAEAGAATGDDGDGGRVQLHGRPFGRRRVAVRQRARSWREMTSRWIWLVPSKIWVTFASRM